MNREELEQVISGLNKDYTNAKLAVLFFAMTALIFANDIFSDMVASFTVWGVSGITAALISAITYYERK